MDVKLSSGSSASSPSTSEAWKFCEEAAESQFFKKSTSSAKTRLKAVRETKVRPSKFALLAITAMFTSLLYSESKLVARFFATAVPYCELWLKCAQGYLLTGRPALTFVSADVESCFTARVVESVVQGFFVVLSPALPQLESEPVSTSKNPKLASLPKTASFQSSWAAWLAFPSISLQKKAGQNQMHQRVFFYSFAVRLCK